MITGTVASFSAVGGQPDDDGVIRKVGPFCAGMVFVGFAIDECPAPTSSRPTRIHVAHLQFEIEAVVVDREAIRKAAFGDN